MTEEQKIAFLERLAASGANIKQVNLGDGYQYFGCSVNQKISDPSHKVEVVDVIPSSVPDKKEQSLFPFISNPQTEAEVVSLLRSYWVNKTSPKDIMMPVRAAYDAGVIRRPTFKEFNQAFPDITIKAKSSFGDYLIDEDNAHSHPFDGVEAYAAMVDAFRKLLQF